MFAIGTGVLSAKEGGSPMAALFGEYRHKIDAKGRISLPAAFRKALTEDTQLVTVPDKTQGSLSIYTVETYEAWVAMLFEKRGGYDPSNRDHVLLRKKLNSIATPGYLDSAYRISVSPKNRELAGLDKDVVLIGDTDHFEIWDAKRWDDFSEDIDLDSLMFS